jgi:tetratricopeptide (TPR) repeat protein
MKHNDFTSQGAIGRTYCLPYAIEKEKYKTITQNYLHLCEAVLKFTAAYSKVEKTLDKNEIQLNPDWKFEVVKEGQKLPSNTMYSAKVGACPTVPQFIDIFNYRGINSFEEAYVECKDTLIKKQAASDVFDFVLELDDTAKVINYLNWVNKFHLAEDNLENMYASIFATYMFDKGDGTHYSEALPICRWMIDNFPKNRYGYLGMAIFLINLNSHDALNYCKQLVALDPNYLNTPQASFWDENTQNRIKICLEKK